MSEKRKHSPGPWAVVETDGGHEIYMASRLESPGFYKAHHIVEYDHGCFEDNGISPEQAAEAEANAHLIAAAPELLEALEALGVIGDGYCFCSTERSSAKELHEPECRDARTALAKARGEVGNE